MENNTVNVTKRDSIKRKIQALLAKTTENGASENEALLALEKANALMIEYYLDFGDLDEIKRMDIVTETYTITSGYNKHTGFLYAIERLFNTSMILNTDKNTTKIRVYGLIDDVKLSIYFIDFIVKSMETEYKKFTHTFDYLILKQDKKYGEKRIKSNWFVGYKQGVSNKIFSIYEQRMQYNQKYGLVCVEVRSKVDDFIKMNFTKITKLPPQKFTDLMVFDMGQTAGEMIDIIQPLHENEDEETNILEHQLQLN